MGLEDPIFSGLKTISFRVRFLVPVFFLTSNYGQAHFVFECTLKLCHRKTSNILFFFPEGLAVGKEKKLIYPEPMG